MISPWNPITIQSHKTIIKSPLDPLMVSGPTFFVPTPRLLTQQLEQTLEECLGELGAACAIARAVIRSMYIWYMQATIVILNYIIILNYIEYQNFNHILIFVRMYQDIHILYTPGWLYLNTHTFEHVFVFWHLCTLYRVLIEWNSLHRFEAQIPFFSSLRIARKIGWVHTVLGGSIMAYIL